MDCGPEIMQRRGLWDNKTIYMQQIELIVLQIKYLSHFNIYKSQLIFSLHSVPRDIPWLFRDINCNDFHFITNISVGKRNQELETLSSKNS